MHSSRMRTGRSLTVCRSLLWGGVCSGGCLLPGGGLLPGGSAPWGCLLSGVSALGGVCSGGCALGGVCSGEGVCSRGGGWVWVSQHALRQTPPLLTESQTPVKTLPWSNFVAARNDTFDVHFVLPSKNLTHYCNYPDSKIY